MLGPRNGTKVSLRPLENKVVNFHLRPQLEVDILVATTWSRVVATASRKRRLSIMSQLSITRQLINTRLPNKRQRITRLSILATKKLVVFEEEEAEGQVFEVEEAEVQAEVVSSLSSTPEK
jgi:hypothetical protein